MEEVHHNYLGLDVGTAKVGIALAHEETGLALAYGIVPNDETFLETIGALIEKEAVGTVVIGIPEHKKHEGEYLGENFGKELQERYGVEVVYENEMFTTKMAQENLKSTGGKGISARDDAEAARIILTSYIDKMSKK